MPRVWRRVRRWFGRLGCSSLITRRTRGSLQSHALSPTSYLLLLLLLLLLLALLLLVLLLRAHGVLLVLLVLVALALLRHPRAGGGDRRWIRAHDPVDLAPAHHVEVAGGVLAERVRAVGRRDAFGPITARQRGSELHRAKLRMAEVGVQIAAGELRDLGTPVDVSPDDRVARSAVRIV